MILHIVLLMGFIFSSVVCGRILWKAIDDYDNGKDPIYWIAGGWVGVFGLAIFIPATIASAWLILLDLGWV